MGTRCGIRCTCPIATLLCWIVAQLVLPHRFRKRAADPEWTSLWLKVLRSGGLCCTENIRFARTHLRVGNIGLLHRPLAPLGKVDKPHPSLSSSEWLESICFTSAIDQELLQTLYHVIRQL